MSDIKVIYNANVYIDGNDLLGKASEFKLPEFEFEQDEYKGLGLKGTVKLPMGVSALEGEITWNSFFPEVARKAANPYKAVQLMVRANVETYDTTGRVKEVPLVTMVTATFSKNALGGYKPKEKAEFSSTYQATEIRQVLDGREVLYYNALRKNQANPFIQEALIICSYQFAKTEAANIKRIPWDLVVFDEAHRLRNVYKKGNIIARTLKNAMAHVQSKVLLTATPLQNSLLELYGLVSIIDGRVFGDLDSFRAQFTGRANFDALRKRLAPVCKRTLRSQVQPYVPYTARRAIVQEFTPSDEERELSRLVADYLRRPDLKALPEGQRQLISLVLWKLLASSSRAIAGALATMAERLQNLLNSGNSEALAQSLDEDYEGLADTADEWEGDEDESALASSERAAIAAEIAELRPVKKPSPIER